MILEIYLVIEVKLKSNYLRKKKIHKGIRMRLYYQMRINKISIKIKKTFKNKKRANQMNPRMKLILNKILTLYVMEREL